MNHKLQRNFYIFLIIGIAAIINGCGNEDLNLCETPRIGESYMLSDTGQEFVNPYMEANKIIFETPTSEEVIFEVNTLDTISSYSRGGICESNPSEGQTVNGTSQLIKIKLSNHLEFVRPFIINLFETPSNGIVDNQETLGITFGELFSNDIEEEDVLFFYQIDTTNTDVNFLDSLDIYGKVFYSVYEMNSTAASPRIEIKYTKTEGIVYIKDIINLNEFIYNRKE